MPGGTGGRWRLVLDTRVGLQTAGEGRRVAFSGTKCSGWGSFWFQVRGSPPQYTEAPPPQYLVPENPHPPSPPSNTWYQKLPCSTGHQKLPSPIMYQKLVPPDYLVPATVPVPETPHPTPQYLYQVSYWAIGGGVSGTQLLGEGFLIRPEPPSLLLRLI